MNSQVSGNLQLWTVIVELPYSIYFNQFIYYNHFTYYLFQLTVVIDYTLKTDNGKPVV